MDVLPIVDPEALIQGGVGEPRKYPLRVILMVSTLVIGANSFANLSMPWWGAAEVVEKCASCGWKALPTIYGMVLLDLVLFALALALLILSALALNGDASYPPTAPLIRWVERRQVMLLCSAFVLLVLSFVVRAFRAAVAADPAVIFGTGSHLK